MRIIRVALLPLALVSAVLLSACGSSSTSTSTSGAAPVRLAGSLNDHGSKTATGNAATISIEVDDNYFDPTFVKASPGAAVTVTLRNEGKNTHTFTVTGTSIDQVLAPGKDATVTVTIPRSGALMWHCRFHGNLGMQGAFYTASGQAPVNASGAAPSGATNAPTTPAPAPTSGSNTGNYGY